MQVLVRRPLTSFFGDTAPLLGGFLDVSLLVSALAAMLLLVPGYEISDKERTAVSHTIYQAPDHTSLIPSLIPTASPQHCSLTDIAGCQVAEAFASLGNGGPSLPKSQLRPLVGSLLTSNPHPPSSPQVSSVVERSSNGKFSPDMHRKHVDFLMTGGNPTILRERVWWGSLCPRLCRISGHKPRAGLHTRTVPNQVDTVSCVLL